MSNAAACGIQTSAHTMLATVFPQPAKTQLLGMRLAALARTLAICCRVKPCVRAVRRS